MGSGRDQWPTLVAGTARAGLCWFADECDALGGTAATAQSTRSVHSTRTKPAVQASAVRTSSRTTTDAPSGVVAVAQAGHALSRATGGAGTHAASQPSLWRVVPPDCPVY